MPRPSRENTTVDAFSVELGRKRQISRSDECLLCPDPFMAEEAVIRVRDHQSQRDLLIHRRCMDAFLGSAPKDGQVAAKEFDRYRRKLVARYTP